jgi:hypothetical protein
MIDEEDAEAWLEERAPYVPSPTAIRKATLAIQAEWSPLERALRAGVDLDTAINGTVVYNQMHQTATAARPWHALGRVPALPYSTRDRLKRDHAPT